MITFTGAGGRLEEIGFQVSPLFSDIYRYGVLLSCLLSFNATYKLCVDEEKIFATCLFNGSPLVISFQLAPSSIVSQTLPSSVPAYNCPA